MTMLKPTVTKVKPTVTSFEVISEIFGRKTNYQARKRLECSLVWTHFFNKRNIRDNSELLPVNYRVPEAVALFFCFFVLLCCKQPIQIEPFI